MPSHHPEAVDSWGADWTVVPAPQDQTVHLRGTGELPGGCSFAAQQPDDPLVIQMQNSKKFTWNFHLNLQEILKQMKPQTFERLSQMLFKNQIEQITASDE